MGSKCATVERTALGTSPLRCCNVQRRTEDLGADAGGASKQVVAFKAGSSSPETSSTTGRRSGRENTGGSSPSRSPLRSPARTPSPKGEEGGRAAKNPLLLKSALAKVRGALHSTVEDLKKFREFLRPLYPSPSEAFKAVGGGLEEVDKALFVRKLKELGFEGNAVRVFQALVDGDGHLTLSTFKQRMKGEQKQATGIMGAVHLAQELNGDATAEGAGRRMAHELKSFREFVEPLFSSKKDAFNFFSRDKADIDAVTFAGQLRMLHYTEGDPDSLFNLLANKSGKLTKQIFLERFETPLHDPVPAAVDQDSMRSSTRRSTPDSQRRRASGPAGLPVHRQKSRSASSRGRTSQTSSSRVRNSSEPVEREPAPARSRFSTDPGMILSSKPPAAPKVGPSPRAGEGGASTPSPVSGNTSPHRSLSSRRASA